MIKRLETPSKTSEEELLETNTVQAIFILFECFPGFPMNEAQLIITYLYLKFSKVIIF